MNEKNPVSVVFSNPLTLDKLYDLAAAYTMPPNTLIELAVKRLLDDVDFVRGLRAGKQRPE